MHRREIGSEFHIGNDLESRSNTYSIFDYLGDFYTAYFDSGRSALRALLEGIRYQSILLPGYICESVRACFHESCTVHYYEIDDDFNIVWDDLLKKSAEDIDIVYLHYFNGCISPNYDLEALVSLKRKHNLTIIEDTTHSLFSAARTVGDYCICSLRKWFPIADGGVLYSQNPFETKPRSQNAWAGKKQLAMVEKGNYLQGAPVDKQQFLDDFSHAEDSLDNQGDPFAITQASYEALKSIDCPSVIAARKNNYAILQSSIPCRQVSFGGVNQVPLFFTIRVENRDPLRKYLIQNHIYCPVHWPLYDELRMLPGSVQNAQCELSIPIDQRYGEEDMLYIANVYQQYVQQGESK